MLHHFIQAPVAGQFFPKERGENFVLCLFPHPQHIFSVSVHIYRHLINVSGDEGSLHVLQRRVVLREEVDEDLVTVP